jgi:hypothetical protein
LVLIKFLGGKDMKKETIGLLIVILLLTGALFALIQKQDEQIQGIHRTIEIMADMQSNTTEWLSDVHELAADSALRIARLER